MTDPYKVLGISPDATDEQVKSAYRDLAKKYHPDNYVNNPLSDLAQEKMKDINEAYDMIMTQRRQGGGAYGGAGYSGRSASSSQFSDIRQLIRNNRIEEAEELLNGIPTQNRDAEWHFLKGNICYSRGWLDDAADFFTRASNMDPANQEYKAALNQLLWQRNGGVRGGYGTRNVYGNQSSDECGICDICSGLMCLDCMCGSGRMCC